MEPQGSIGSAALGAEPLDVFRAAPRALLEAASSRHPVEVDWLGAFARAFLDADELGRLALAVLHGGLFAGRRTVELAAAVVETETDAEAVGHRRQPRELVHRFI